MQVYNAPLDDMKFVLHELLGGELARQGVPPGDVGRELIDAVLAESARFVTGELLPLNASGDAEGCRLENGLVRTPAGFREAYKAYADAGWTASNAPVEYGGEGLPEPVGKMLEEMACAANLSFSLYPGLTRGAVEAISSHATDELKARYLPKLVSGEWTGSMCLTEAHCGTDLGLLRTRAVPAGDGTYRITGSKIFISAGEHDLAPNIIHLVLARLPDAPAGVKGISLFLLPKFLGADDGAPPRRNGVVCTSVEHKMGMRGSATAALSFDDATGWLIGEPNKGMQAMFTMMNNERLAVGIQGLGVAEAAYQSAVFYALDRQQGRGAAGRAGAPTGAAADPIIVHPDVRRMLMTMRATTEGCRALGAWVACGIEASRAAIDPVARQEADDFVALMTPVVKALFTDLASEAANLAVQVYGGHGYIRDHGVEQYVRDARICQIYEGTNGIQALDLVGRKLTKDGGRLLRTFFDPIGAFIEAHRDDAGIGELVSGLGHAFDALQKATSHIVATMKEDSEDAISGATDYLRLFGMVGLGYMFCRSAQVAATRGSEDFYADKLVTARFFMERMLPPAAALAAVITAGKGSMMAIEHARFLRVAA